MSDDKVIHVAHEFVPKLLRRKVEAAIANRKAFVEERKKRMVPLLLANRNAFSAHRALPWYKKFSLSGLFFDKDVWTGEILSVEEAVKVPFTDYDRLRAASDPWRWSGRTHKYDPLVWGPHYTELRELMDEISSGSKWVEHIYALHDNLKRTPTRRVSVSESVLSSITYWAAHDNPLEP